MYYDRYVDILETMKQMGYANTNLVIGIGGLLLQQHNRDDLGFAFKATYAEINGVATELYKDPITDPGKKSHKGLMCLIQTGGRGLDDKLNEIKVPTFITVDQATKEQETFGALVTVFKYGKITKSYSLTDVRERANV